VARDTWRNLSDEKRGRVTKAAIAEFARRGFAAGSMNVIAREAGVSKGSLFQYFDDKLDLFATISSVANEDLRVAVLGDVDVERDPLFPSLRRMATRWIAYFREHPVERAAGFATAHEIDDDARAAVRRVTNAGFVEVLRPMVCRARDRGELRPGVDVDQVVSMVVLVLRHLNTAPFYSHVDPVLRLDQLSAPEVDRVAIDFVDAIERAYASNPEDR
jgi:AcrR family transcriptional regulator